MRLHTYSDISSDRTDYRFPLACRGLQLGRCAIYDRHNPPTLFEERQATCVIPSRGRTLPCQGRSRGQGSLAPHSRIKYVLT